MTHADTSTRRLQTPTALDEDAADREERSTPKEEAMKKIVVVAFVLALSACASKKEEMKKD